jgi:hypothetical protein
MRFALFFAAIALVRAQGAPPKTNAGDYPVHVQLDSVTLAAEYLVHSLPTAKGTLVVNDYLVVEAAFFGPSLSRLKMSPDNFTLRINGRGAFLPTQTAGMVAESIKYPGVRPHLEGSVGNGDGTVTVGPRPPQSRFPGDGKDRQRTPTITEKQDDDAVEYRVQSVSLPEGEHSLPRAGLLYFAHTGKVKNIRSIELFYDGPMGKATLKLLP